MRSMFFVLLLIAFATDAMAFDDAKLQQMYHQELNQLALQNLNAEQLVELKIKNENEIKIIKTKLSVLGEFIDKDSGFILNLSTYFVESCLLDNNLNSDHALIVVHSLGCNFAQSIILFIGSEVVTAAIGPKVGNKVLALTMAVSAVDLAFKVGFNIVSDKEKLYYRNKIKKHIKSLDKEVVRAFLNARVYELSSEHIKLAMQNKATEAVLKSKQPRHN